MAGPLQSYTPKYKEIDSKSLILYRDNNRHRIAVANSIPLYCNNNFLLKNLPKNNYIFFIILKCDMRWGECRYDNPNFLLGATESLIDNCGNIYTSVIETISNLSHINPFKLYNTESDIPFSDQLIDSLIVFLTKYFTNKPIHACRDCGGTSDYLNKGCTCGNAVIKDGLKIDPVDLLVTTIESYRALAKQLYEPYTKTNVYFNQQLQDENTKLQLDISELKVTIELLNSDIEKQKTNIKELENTIEELKDEIETLSFDLSDKTKNSENLLIQISELEYTIKKK